MDTGVILGAVALGAAGLFWWRRRSAIAEAEAEGAAAGEAGQPFRLQGDGSGQIVHRETGAVMTLVQSSRGEPPSTGPGDIPVDPNRRSCDKIAAASFDGGRTWGISDALGRWRALSPGMIRTVTRRAKAAGVYGGGETWNIAEDARGVAVRLARLEQATCRWATARAGRP